jgi:hypothetical protein
MLRCNVVFGNALGLVLEENLADASFPSWCNVFFGNVFILVIEGQLACARFPSQSMLFLAMHLSCKES